jgi:hypothetical protein
MHPIQELFLEGFSYVLQIDMRFIGTPMWTKFYSCKKWVLQFYLVYLYPFSFLLHFLHTHLSYTSLYLVDYVCHYAGMSRN